jgi:hypothetical protein
MPNLPINTEITDTGAPKFFGLSTTAIKPVIDPNIFTPEEIKADIEAITDTNEVTGEWLLNRQVTEIKFLIDGLFQRCGLGCLAGPSDTGKSMLLRMLTIAVVTRQTHFLGFELKSRHFSSIYVSTEDQETETAFLLLKQSKGWPTHDFKRLRFVFDTNDLLCKLDRMLTTSPADVIVIDCFSDAFGGDLKDTQKIRTYLHTFQELAAKHDTLILFLHHTGKRTENYEPSKNNLLAGQGFEAKMRIVIELRSDLSNPNYRHLCVVKGNYLPSHMKRESFMLEFMDDSFLFRNTGDRVPYEHLSRQPEDNGKSKYEQAKELKAQGLSYEKIAEKIGYASKGTVSKLFANAEKNGWDKPTVSLVVSKGNI